MQSVRAAGSGRQRADADGERRLLGPPEPYVFFRIFIKTNNHQFFFLFFSSEADVGQKVIKLGHRTTEVASQSGRQSDPNPAAGMKLTVPIETE